MSNTKRSGVLPEIQTRLLSMSVRDDGKGFAYRADETPSSGGMGLRLMAYRVRVRA